MKYDNEKYVNIKTVCEYLESSFSDNLLKFHSLTGYYSTSYFYRVGKIKVWKNLVKKTEKINSFSLGVRKDLSVNDFENYQKFVKTAIYSGQETRFSLSAIYQNLS